MATAWPWWIAWRRDSAASQPNDCTSSCPPEVSISPTVEGRASLRQAIHHGHAVASCELLTAYRAVTLSSHPVPPGCRPLLDALTGIVGRIDADRPFGEDIERLTTAALARDPAAEPAGTE